MVAGLRHSLMSLNLTMSAMNGAEFVLWAALALLFWNKGLHQRFTSNQRFEAVCAKQVPSDWQGRGPGISRGPGPLADAEVCRVTVCVVAGANEAEARPATATSRANMRMTDFIFGNLFEFDIERDASLSSQGSYSIFSSKSSFFINITK